MYVSKLIGLASSRKEICNFCIVLLCIRGQIPITNPPGGLIFGGAYFRNFTVDCDVVIEGYEYCMPLGRAFNTCKQISVNYNLFILIFGIIGVGIYSIEDGIQSVWFSC